MDSRKLAAQFQKLTRSTAWELKEQLELSFNNYHSQGLVRIGELFYLSSVELVEKPAKYDKPADGYDRSSGRGIGHLFVFDRRGKLLSDLLLGEGSAYHPGGIDFDGTHIWVPVAEYRPHSRSIVYKVDPVTMTAETAFRVDDHIGGLVRYGQYGTITGNSWGSRKFYEWDPNGQLLRLKENKSHYVDYQDGQYIGDGKMVLSGISELPNPAVDNARPFELGGLALIEMKTWDTIHEAPVTEFSPRGHVITRNPVFVESAGQELRLYAVPDDDDGSLLVYETCKL